MLTSACLAGADAEFASSLWAVEGTRLANFASEKSVFINMHGHPLPLKQAFVAQQKRGRAGSKGKTDGYRYTMHGERTEMHREMFGTLVSVCSSHLILISSEMLGKIW